MIILRKALLETTLFSERMRYDQLFRTYQVLSDTEKKTHKILLESSLLEIESLQRELDEVNRRNNIS